MVLLLVIVIILCSPLVPFMIAQLFGWSIDKYSILGQRSFTPRLDGKFSWWQILGQIATVLPVIILCVIGLIRFVLAITGKSE